MRNPTVIRYFDRILELLSRAEVKRARRWSFLVTLPVGIAIGSQLGLRPSPENGLLVAALMIALDVAVLVAVTTLGVGLLGRERRDVLLDLLMHPVARRAITGELRVFGVYPRALLWRLGRPRRDRLRFTYHRGSSSLVIAIAILPAVAAEAAAFHLLLPDAWVVVKLALLVLTAYSVVMMVGLAVGERVYPHELTSATLTLRSATLYRAAIPLHDIANAELRRERAGGRGGLLLDDDGARIVARGRTDLVLTLHRPVLIERPLGDPVAVRRLAVAVDDPAGLVEAIASPPPPQSPARRRVTRWIPAVDAVELAVS